MRLYIKNKRDLLRPRKKWFLKKRSLLLLGMLLGIASISALYQTSIYFSTNESCMMCHVHPHAEESWRLSKHVNSKSGVMTNCVDCHLPPKEHTWNYLTAKASLGLKDVWGYLTKDSSDFNWEKKASLEHAVKYIPNESCKKCHQNLFPQGISDDGITAHLYYEENEKALDLQCISCHLDVGHYNPNYSHTKMSGIPGAGAVLNEAVDSESFFKEATSVTSFTNYTEQIPGTMISFRMIAIPGGTFTMGSTKKESFHQPDEAPAHQVTLSPFFMAEVETTWDQFWAFYGNTMSEGRTTPEYTFEKNLLALEVDAISGPTPPFGFPDQGWGGGDRPAITMTHYAAETFCQWLSLKTGKKYRLPTEAEWEYAARGGTQTAYFFQGNPKSFSNKGFLRTFISAKTDSISEFVIYEKNSQNRTQTAEAVLANPFGLKNMLGNVMEYCADKYDPNAYSKRTGETKDPIVTEGEDWVTRGGSYNSDASDLRCAARDQTQHVAWMKTDPQQPKSIWWYSDIRGIGFRVVCELDSSINGNKSADPD